MLVYFFRNRVFFFFFFLKNTCKILALLFIHLFTFIYLATSGCSLVAASGTFCCDTWALEHAGSVATWRAGSLFPNQGLSFLHWKADS